MKKYFFTLIAVLLLVNLPMAFSQKKAAFTDKAQFLNERVESSLTVRLRADSVEMTSLIDTRKRCDYWFSELTKNNGNLFLSVTDCNDVIIGKKDLGSTIFTASDEEKGLLLYFAFADIIRNPGKSGLPVSKPQEYPGRAVTASSTDVNVDAGQHRSRYFLPLLPIILKRVNCITTTSIFLFTMSSMV